MAEEIGRVNDQLEAYIAVRLGGGVIECLIDTGFGGTLLLPRSIATQNNLPITGQENLGGVEGFAFTAQVAAAQVSWLGDDFLVQVFISDYEEALLGVEMLVDAKLEIDYLKLTARIVKMV